MDTAFASLHPTVAAWCDEKLGSATPPQRRALPLGVAGRNVLISSPTGTGKTLAAFLPVMSRRAALRDAGPVVRLSRYGVLAVARYDEVQAVLADWRAFSSARGVGLSDFAKEKPWRLPSLVLETDPPLHDRTRKVLDGVLSPAALRRLRAGFQDAADALVDALLARGGFDAIPDLAEAYPLTVFPDAVGMPRENRHHLLPYGNMVFNSFGPHNEFFHEATKDAAPVLAWLETQMQRGAFAPGGFGLYAIRGTEPELKAETGQSACNPLRARESHRVVCTKGVAKQQELGLSIDRSAKRHDAVLMPPMSAKEAPHTPETYLIDDAFSQLTVERGGNLDGCNAADADNVSASRPAERPNP